MTTPQFITVTHHEQGIAQITISRPEALNALNAQVLAELYEAVSALNTLPELSAVVVTGEGRAFVAGADIKAMQGLSADEAQDFARSGHQAMSALASLPVPVIAAVNGFALGGGLELALSCDLIYASTKAKLGLPEVGLGLIPGFGGTQRLIRLIGPQAARQLVFTADMISAQEALRIGLVLGVSEPETLLDDVMKVANTIASRGPNAVRAAKRVMRDGAELPLADGLQLEVDAFQQLFDHHEPREGMAAHLEQRATRFRNT